MWGKSSAGRREVESHGVHMSDQSPSKGRDSRLAISGWPLRSKVALALAIPLLLAATFGGLRVTNDLKQSNNASASSQQVTVVAPAIDYLTAAEKGMVAAQSSTNRPAAADTYSYRWHREKQSPPTRCVRCCAF